MSAYIGNSGVFGSGWMDPFVAEIFSDRQTLSRWLKYCEVVAVCQGKLGLLPVATAEATAAACRSVVINPEAMGLIYKKTGHSLQGFIEEFNRQSPSEAQAGFCWGLTVQDITDSARALALQELNPQMTSCLEDIATGFQELVLKSAGTLQLGRTHGQVGGLISFGLKVLPFRADLHNRIADFKLAALRLERVQLAGSVGGLTAFGDQGWNLRKLVAQDLNLQCGVSSWTAVRGDIRSYARAIQAVSEIFAQFANEIVNLQRTEIAEVLENCSASSVSSITMPHKRNPENAEQIVALGGVVRSQAELLATGYMQEHERDGVGWKLEWVALPLLLGTFFCQARAFRDWLKGLEIRSEKMSSHIRAAGLPCFFDQILMSLGRKMPLGEARSLLSRISKQDPSSAREVILKYLSEPELEDIVSFDRNSRVLEQLCRLGLAELKGET